MTGDSNNQDLAVLSEEKAAEQREHARRSVLWPAELKLASVKLGRHVFPCQIWNMSLGGARLRIDVPLQSGTEVYLSIPERGDVPATVVWTEGQRMGLKFRSNPDQIELMFEDRLEALGLTVIRDDE